MISQVIGKYSMNVRKEVVLGFKNMINLLTGI